ncbi:DMT family transporter [Pseudodesulfovibrio sediminis]|uniref:QacE family quaternary ammonium compound efflux SMR transporter n=1 Tax=Pseudodesulfovibrio sediminis TaxID=2810563 RepID=A0ABM7PAE2_9BACT|nr:SMR family transporter [Pseudodesulfovibrio sediminis]BCS90092.1 QacE family quaternary ammonium compound efflux SMR transporter [Pseudodesulfovibrio sediminis]
MGNLYLAFAIITEVIGTAALGASHGFTRLVPSCIAVIGYCLSFYLLSLTLKTSLMGIGLVYAIWAGLGIVLICITGIVIHKQIPDIPAIIGMAFIIIGVVVINLFSKTGH